MYNRRLLLIFYNKFSILLNITITIIISDKQKYPKTNVAHFRLGRSHLHKMHLRHQVRQRYNLHTMCCFSSIKYLHFEICVNPALI